MSNECQEPCCQRCMSVMRQIATEVIQQAFSQVIRQAASGNYHFVVPRHGAEPAALYVPPVRDKRD